MAITLKYANEHPNFDSHINAISDGISFKLATVPHIFYRDAESWQDFRFPEVNSERCDS